MIASSSVRLVGYAGLAATFLLAALALQRPELAALAAPFALLAAAGIAAHRPPELRVRLELEDDRAIEDDEVEARLVLASATGADRVETAVLLPPGLEAVGAAEPRSLRLRAGEERELPLRIRCARWGGYVLGDVVVRVRDRLGFRSWEARYRDPASLRVYPRVEQLRSLVPPLETQVYVGNQVSAVKGEGIEFADIRPFASGDRVRRINWRASARRGSLQVNDRHPERNTDVVLFLDTFVELRGESGGTIDAAVRAASSLAALYLGRKDRVGLVGFGGLVRWLVPSTGIAQLYRIVDSLILTDVVFSYARHDLDVLPPRSLPPKALVIALTPLLDTRSAGALLDLRARGFDLVVVEVSPLPFVEPGRGGLERLAYRIWLLQRDVLRQRFAEVGVPVIEWRGDVPLDAALEEVTAYRRFARPARV